jgi:hypothetical protein
MRLTMERKVFVWCGGDAGGQKPIPPARGKVPRDSSGDSPAFAERQFIFFV